MQDKQEGDAQFLQKPKIHKIGSVKNGKVNYDRDEQFFSQDDIPNNAQVKKDIVQKYIDPDLLGLRKKEWNNSVSVPKNPLLEETHERKLIKIKLGLFDHPIPKLKDKQIEPGTDTRNDYMGWNVSTELNYKQNRKTLTEFTQQALAKNKEKEKMLLTQYSKPVERQSEYNSYLRERKQLEKEMRDQIRSDFLFNNPAASKEKTDAAVFRLTFETKQRKNQMKNDPTATFKPDLGTTLKQEVEQKTYHTGRFQIFRFKQHDLENGQDEHSTEYVEVGAWSCCQNEDPKSLGCNRFKVDKKHWNYSSYNQK